MDIPTALATLRHDDDTQWTTSGLPRLDVVSEVFGETVTRKQVTDALPNFVRHSALPSTTEDATDADSPPVSVGRSELPPVVEVQAFRDVRDPSVYEENAADHAEVPSQDEVTTMPVAIVVSNLALIDRALKEFSTQTALLGARSSAINAKVKDLASRVKGLTNARQRLIASGLAKEAPKSNPIRNYINRQNEIRQAKAARRDAFLKGMDPQEVKDALGGPSQLDASMKARKAKRGSARPAYPMQ